MDPLSGAIAVAQTIISGSKALKTLYDAGSEIDALVEEISEVKMVISDVERASMDLDQRETLSPTRNDSINHLVSSAKVRLDILNAIVNQKLSHSRPTGGENRTARLSWLRQKSNIKTQLEDLRHTREKLSTLLDAQNLIATGLIRAKIDDLTPLLEKQTQQLVRHTKELNHFSHHLENTNRFQQKFAVHAIPPNSQHTWVTMDPMMMPESIDKSEELGLLGQPSNLSGTAKSKGSIGPDVAVRTRPPRYPRNSCSGWCSCQCHALTYFQTPQSFDLLIGLFILSYSGMSFKKRPCNEPGCRRQSTPTLRFNFYFPQWMMSRVIQCVALVSDVRGPELLLRVPCVVPDNATSLFYAVQGNLEGIKSLFSKGMASPYDVALHNGKTALHYAVIYRHRQLSQFLLDTGASPDVEDKNKTTTVALAWERLFGAVDDSSVMADDWRCMFDDEEYLESRVFPTLHKIILGLSHVNLRQHLELSSSNIDDRDIGGRTALSWAAAKADVKTVETLLEFGANPNIASKRGHGPLNWAAQSSCQGRQEVIKKLLDSNLDVNWVDGYNRTALITSATDSDDPECLDLLIAYGANINWQDCHQRTAIGCASKMNRIANLQYLLAAGADYRIPDHWGHTPHIEAMYQNHHAVLEVLLDRDPLFLPSRLTDGRTVFHVAAAHADAKTFQLLIDKADLSLIGIGNLDSAGRSYRDIFEARDEVPEELQMAFKQFCSKLINADPHTDQTESEDPEDYFMDALE